MVWIAPLLVVLGLFTLEFFTYKRWLRAVIFAALSVLLMGLVVAIDFAAQSTDTEVWSGYVEDWNHEEEYEEWIPRKEVCSTNSDGSESCYTKPGYWKYHESENYVKTTDNNGWIRVYESPEGKEFDDNYPNTSSELAKLFPKGMPTASKHTYVNKVQASYSIYRHEDIDEKEYPDLPEYPDEVRDYFYIDRILGDVPKKKKALGVLNQINSDLNRMVPDPENEGKKKSYKQVNLIFVNVGEGKPVEYGFALQNKWEGGNKNDFIVAFSMDKNNTVEWAYPFSWSEVELLKLEVKDVMESQKQMSDFSEIVNEVGQLVEEQFVRKQFADFDYLQLETSTTAHVFIWVTSGLMAVLHLFLPIEIGGVPRRRY